MADEHPHTGSTLHWGWGQVIRHLKNAHGVSIPMSWTVGQAHDAHLKAHVQGNLAQLDRECQAYYGVGDGTAAICRRPDGHPEISEDGIGHSPQPIPIQTKKEQPVPDTDDLETLARHLWMEAEDKRVPSGWDDLGQETRDYWRQQAQIKADKERQREIGYAAAGAERTERDKDQRILTDRLISAMAGLDFESQWAHDGGIGPSARGLLREQHGRGAERLLKWLLRGGALHLEPVVSLASDLERAQEGLAEAREERDRALEAVMAAQTKAAELRQELNHAGGEREALRESMNSARVERDLLRLDKARLKAELEQMVTGNQRNVGSIDALEAALEEARQDLGASREKQRLLVVERDQMAEEITAKTQALAGLQEQVYRLRKERDEAAEDRLHAVASANRLSSEVAGLRDQLHLLQGRWERVVPRLEQRLMARTQALEEGRARLHEWEAEIQKASQAAPGADWLDFDGQQILDRIDQILGKATPTAEPEPLLGVVTPLSPFDSQGRDPHEDTEAEQVQDNLAWARRFINGWNA